MEGSVFALAASNLFLGLIFAALYFVILTPVARCMVWLIFDTGGGAALFLVPAGVLVGIGILAYQSFAPPVLDWSLRAMVLFLPPAICVLVAAYPFARLYGRPARPGQSAWLMSASASFIPAGAVPFLMTYFNLLESQLDELVTLPVL